ncbi:hypothetical protein ABPG74_006715, partial [Tetrahymena malaccensis]
GNVISDEGLPNIGSELAQCTNLSFLKLCLFHNQFNIRTSQKLRNRIKKSKRLVVKQFNLF